MLLHVLLKVLDLTSIYTFKLDNKEYSLRYLRDNYDTIDIVRARITVEHRTLFKEDISILLDVDNLEHLDKYTDAEIIIPEASIYAHMVLNIFTDIKYIPTV
jgi:hypothetical protein